jgi:hypothetical protein
MENWKSKGKIKKTKLKKCPNKTVLGIRIRIRMFLALPDQDPDPLARGMDPAPDTSLFSYRC